MSEPTIPTEETPWEGRHKLIADCKSHVGPGWHDILTRLVDGLFELGWDGQVLQVKEKFGGLRFYVGSSSMAIHDRIQEAENEAAKTCEECGAPGVLRDGSWLKTLCDEHGGSPAHPHVSERFKRG